MKPPRTTRATRRWLALLKRRPPLGAIARTMAERRDAANAALRAEMRAR